MAQQDSSRKPHIHDVVVVGARCAGAATAMLLARQGFDVVVLDRVDFPSDTLSTHAIARGGIVQLARWGLLDEVIASGAPPIRSISFHFPGGELVREVKDRAGVDHLLAPRRYVLDMIMLDAARSAGATVRTGMAVTGTLTDRSGRVVGVAMRDRDGNARDVRARYVVGADGLRSRIARAVRPRVIDDRGTGTSMRYAYVAGLGAEGFEFHLAPGGFAGVFPTHNGEANVWAGTPAGRRAGSSLEDLLDRVAPSLAARVRAASVVSPVRSAVALPNHVLEPVGPGWALVGDSGYHRDPITGHGITDAFRDAEVLARRLGDILRGDAPEDFSLAAYADERYRALLPVFDVTCRLCEFPPLEEFVALQKRLSSLLDTEAVWLAAQPTIPGSAPSTVPAGRRTERMRRHSEDASRPRRHLARVLR